MVSKLKTRFLKPFFGISVTRVFHSGLSRTAVKFFNTKVLEIILEILIICNSLCSKIPVKNVLEKCHAKKIALKTWGLKLCLKISRGKCLFTE